jgi:hypothetical protein
MDEIINIDADVISELAPYLKEKKVSRSVLVSTILKDILFAEKYAKANQSYAIVEQFLVDLYRMGILEYKDLLPVLGYERALEVTNTIRTAERFKSWLKR